jgi:hypothetical protein
MRVKVRVCLIWIVRDDALRSVGASSTGAAIATEYIAIIAPPKKNGAERLDSLLLVAICTVVVRFACGSEWMIV